MRRHFDDETLIFEVDLTDLLQKEGTRAEVYGMQGCENSKPILDLVAYDTAGTQHRVTLCYGEYTRLGHLIKFLTSDIGPLKAGRTPKEQDA